MCTVGGRCCAMCAGGCATCCWRRRGTRDVLEVVEVALHVMEVMDDMGRGLEVSEGLGHLLVEMMLCMLEVVEVIICDVGYGRWGFCPMVADSHPSVSGSTHACDNTKN